MHVKFVNKFTGSVMYVDEKRASEYAAAGHKPAAVSPAEPVKKPPAKKTAKKPVKKKAEE